VGSGTSSSHKPRSLLLFTNAFIELPRDVRAAGTFVSRSGL
jgi:hypothetical protein